MKPTKDQVAFYFSLEEFAGRWAIREFLRGMGQGELADNLMRIGHHVTRKKRLADLSAKIGHDLTAKPTDNWEEAYMHLVRHCDDSTNKWNVESIPYRERIGTK